MLIIIMLIMLLLEEYILLPHVKIIIVADAECIGDIVFYREQTCFTVCIAAAEAECLARVYQGLYVPDSWLSQCG